MPARHYLAVIAGCALMSLGVACGAWTVEQNYDDLKPGGLCKPFWESHANTRVTAEKSSSGNHACKMVISQGDTGWGGGFVNPERLKRGDELWVRFRLFVPQGFDYYVPDSQGAHLKFIRVELRNAGDSGQGKVDWLWSREGNVPFYITGLERDLCTSNCIFSFGHAAAAPVKGAWETYEMYTKFDHTSADEGGSGRLLFWKNGELIGERTDRPTMYPGADNVVSVMFFSYWNGSSPKTQHVYFDDLIATSKAPSAKDGSGNSYIGVGDFVSRIDTSTSTPASLH